MARIFDSITADFHVKEEYVEWAAGVDPGYQSEEALVAVLDVSYWAAKLYR